MAIMSERLAAVLARCEKIQRGAENLSNLPEHLAERLKVLYSKCERLKHEKEQLRPSEVVILDEDPEDDQCDDCDDNDTAISAGEGPLTSLTFDGEREDVAMTDPYLVCEAEQDLEALGWKSVEPSGTALVESQPSPQASPTQASDVTDADETIDIQKDQSEPSSGCATETEWTEWNDLPIGTEFMAQEVPYVVERKVGQSHGSAIYAIRSATGAGFIVKMSAQNELACARLLTKHGELQRVKLEHITLDIFEASAFIQTLTQVISDFAASSASSPSASAPSAPAALPVPLEDPSKPPMLVPTTSTPQPDQSIFKVLFSAKQTGAETAAAKAAGDPVAVGASHNSLHETTLPPVPPVPVPAEPDPAAPAPAAPALPETAAEISKHSDSADSAVAVTLAPAFPKMPALAASHSKAKPQELPQSLSTMLGNYAEEEDSPETKPTPETDQVQDLAEFHLPKAQTAFGAKIRAAARMAKAAVLPEKAKAPEESAEPLASVDPVPGEGVEGVEGVEGAVQTWDPATGQFITEEIPSEIAEEFKRKPDLNLEDYQQRVLLAQLHDKKRRLQQQQEERERQRRKLEREEAERQKELEQQRSISAVLESYAQEMGEAPRAREALSEREPVEVGAVSATNANATNLQAVQAQFLLQAQQLQQLQQFQQFQQLQQLAAQHAIARPAPAPLLGVVPDPAAAHLGLASQIYAWMAQAGGMFAPSEPSAPC